MTKEEAEKLSVLLLQLQAKLNESVAFVRDSDSKEELEKYRSAIGQVMSVLYLDVEEKLWSRFPELRPDSMDGPYKVDSKIFEPRFYRWDED